MKITFIKKAFFFIALTLSAYPALAQLRVNEIHYDNTGADANERAEIVGAAGTSLSGWSFYGYDGSSGNVNSSGGNSQIIPLGSGTLANTCTVSGVNLGFRVISIVTESPGGLSFQNGAPDGFALVNGSTCYEFLSYEGTFTASNGPCAGVMSTDIGASESGSGASTGSIQKLSNGTWVTDANANTFGACNTPSQSIALPIELVSFSVKGEQAAVNLSWVTALEVNNEYFSVERSSDAKNYTEIAVVKGAVNSTEMKTYEFVDADPLKGFNYYRLKQVDSDGASSYSPVRFAKVGFTNTAKLNPNPVTAGRNATLLYDGDSENDISIEVSNSLGQVILQQQSAVIKGITPVELQLSTLPKGSYFLSTRVGSDIQTQKFIVE